MSLKLGTSLLTLLLVFTVALGAQAQSLAVESEAGATNLTRADLEALPRVKVKAGKPEAEYQGVALRSVLEKAGVAFGETLKGKRLATCLLVEAADGYRAVFALPELDPAFADKQILLVFLRDGKPLDEKEGPYRIVIPDEKRMARWVRQVTKLKIVSVQ